MSVKDISRYLFQPEKRYSGVRMQQGRVILDSDWNESERIDDEEARRTRLETICAKGTSNQGFLIKNIEPFTVNLPFGDSDSRDSTFDTYDFNIEAGSFYLGGLRFEVPQQETFLTQADWLQIDAGTDALPLLPALDDFNDSRSERVDLVFLRGWEQCVTAVEDSELRERALGGPDTSVRIRRMRRVEVLTDVPAGCAAAFNLLKERLTEPRGGEPGGVHEVDEVDCGISSNSRLTVTFGGSGTTEDPCRPEVTAGFLGAENQTIRVQLTAPNRFIWGYNNASPLYRVQVLPNEEGLVKIKFLNLPPDQTSQPLKGHAVEILPWSALLPNQEKVAALDGHLATVASSFDPEDNSLTIATPIPQEWIDWLDGHIEYHSDLDTTGRNKYFYLRLWTGGSGDDALPDHELTPSTAVDLKGTGLSVTFSDFGLPGDHWIVAARPHTPDIVVPWNLMDDARPVGTRFYVAPLALIRWSIRSNQEIVASVQDCRHKFRPLCETSSCCIVRVGDGVSSHGDFNSLETAVESLPKEGGDICLLPGLHRANVMVRDRRNVKIVGCGKETRVIPRDAKSDAPIFRLINSECISLEHMDLVNLGGTAIVVEGSESSPARQIEIAHNRILACERAIHVRDGVEVSIHHNRVRMLDKEDADVAVFLHGEDSLIEHNDIGVVPGEQLPLPDDVPGIEIPDPADPCARPDLFYKNSVFLAAYLNALHAVVITPFTGLSHRALGGVQIGAGSERIKVMDNKIAGGAGNGIALGGVLAPSATEPEEVPEEPAHVIHHEGNDIWAIVSEDNRRRPRLGLLFTRIDEAASVSATTDNFGMLFVDAAAGEYSVRISTPGYRIRDIVTEDSGEFGVAHMIDVEEIEPVVAEGSAFLYEIMIEHNEIENMGRSGIGVPHALDVATTNDAGRAYSAKLGNPVRGLTISQNHIHECLRNPFNKDIRSLVQRQGLGGISLGLCEDLVITHNRVERNGTRHIDPVCGIFIRFGGGADIHHNMISNNGPRVTASNRNLELGLRGGIVMSGGAAGAVPVITNQVRSYSGQHAARIHDNVVQQPVGPALRLQAFGPVSVCNNRFGSEQAGPSRPERMAGAVSIINSGSGVRRFARTPTSRGSNRQSLSGETLFNDNQTWLGADEQFFGSQRIDTGDDLRFCGNQSTSLATDQFFTNTLLVARTLRAADNRFQEPAIGSKFGSSSLRSMSSLFNNSSNNQGDHCIRAFNGDNARPPQDSGNQVQFPESCSALPNLSPATLVPFLPWFFAGTGDETS